MKRQILTIFAISCSVFWGCKPSMDKYQVKPSSGGTADFSRYVSLGNSLTAGYADGALYDEGQRNSYPAMIAEQLQSVGGGSFTIPFVGTENGVAVNYVGGQPFITNKYTLQYLTDCMNNVSLGPKPGGIGSPADQAALLTPKPGPYNNMGVPGAKSFQLGSPYLAQNPFYNRIASKPGSSTVLGDALKLNPTFFSLWIGNNDVLLWAVAGGESDSITSQQTFGYGITQCLDSLTKHGAKGVIANIPDVTATPYCTTVPYNGLVLTNQKDVDGLNAYYAGYFPNAKLVFKLGQNPFVVKSNEDNDPRFITQNEFVLLSVPQDSLKCFKLGSLVPIKDRYFLDANEISQIKTATAGYNGIISGLAAAHKIALVDMNTNLKTLATKDGIIADGVQLTSTFVSGGAFSLDGIHLTPRGYAVVANYYITAINGYYGSSIPTVNVGQYRGVVFP